MDRDQNGGLAFNEKVLEKCKDMYNNGYRINHLLSCIIDICQERQKSADDLKEAFFQIDNALKVIYNKKIVF